MAEVDVTVDPVVAEIEELRRQIKVRQERIAYLKRFRERPTVVPVMHYWRHHREYHEEAHVWSEEDTSALEQAYRQLEGMADMGECASVGVEVGGYEYAVDELEDLFGTVY